MKIKIITGYRNDQYHIIEANEAHKAFYLFLHPESRGVFSNGVAIRGVDIKEIKPAWNESMGWNPTHVLDEDDWNEIHQSGVSRKLQHKILPAAKEVAALMSPEEMSRPLKELAAKYTPALLENTTRTYARGQGMKNLLAASAKKISN